MGVFSGFFFFNYINCKLSNSSYVVCFFIYLFSGGGTNVVLFLRLLVHEARYKNMRHTGLDGHLRTIVLRLTRVSWLHFKLPDTGAMNFTI